MTSQPTRTLRTFVVGVVALALALILTAGAWLLNSKATPDTLQAVINEIVTTVPFTQETCAPHGGYEQEHLNHTVCFVGDNSVAWESLFDRLSRLYYHDAFKVLMWASPDWDYDRGNDLFIRYALSPTAEPFQFVFIPPSSFTDHRTQMYITTRR